MDAKVILDRGVLYIRINNAYNGFIHQILSSGKIKYLTSKEKKSIHGIGLQNVEEVIDKYIVIFTEKNCKFRRVEYCLRCFIEG